MSGTPVLSTPARGASRRVPDRRIRGVRQRDRELHRFGDGARAGVCRRPGRRAARGPRRARSECRRRRARRRRQGDGPSGLVFGRQLRLEDVSRTGISSVTEEEVSQAVSEGKRIREVTTVEGPVARVGARRAGRRRSALRGSTGPTTPSSVARIPLGQVTIVGPGAGLELAGPGSAQRPDRNRRKASPLGRDGDAERVGAQELRRAVLVERSSLGDREAGVGHHGAIARVRWQPPRPASDRLEPVLPAPTPSSGARPCSTKWRVPPGRSTRRSSASAAPTSGIVHSVQVESAESKLSSVERQRLAVEPGALDRDLDAPHSLRRELPAQVGRLDGRHPVDARGDRRGR